jgi:hypothetical protein
MSVVLGKNFTVYLGDSMNTIGCEDNCTVTVTAAEIITTTKGSGRGTNREYGAYDAVLTSTGVVFPYDSESAAASAGKTDVTFLHSYITQAKKVCAKYQLTDGLTTKYVIANWIVRTLTFTGAAEGAMTFDVELALDGQLYESSNIQSSATYDGPSVYVYVAAGTVSNCDATPTINASRIYFVVKTVSSTGQTIIMRATTLFSPSFDNEYIFTTGSGNFSFDANLLIGDTVLISYDPAD